MSVFIPIPKKGNAKQCSNYHTIILISHASKDMLKILQVRPQHYVNREFPDVQLGLEKGGEAEVILLTFVGSWRKEGDFRKTCTSVAVDVCLFPQ